MGKGRALDARDLAMHAVNGGRSFVSVFSSRNLKTIFVCRVRRTVYRLCGTCIIYASAGFVTA
jgi:hypothetical protein